MTDSIALIIYTDLSYSVYIINSNQIWNGTLSVKHILTTSSLKAARVLVSVTSAKLSQYILLFFQQSAYLTGRSRMHRNFAVIHKVRDTEVGNTSLILCRKNA